MAKNKRVLAFMAHPDDAEILCAGTLIKLYAMGWEIHIATATAGDCGTMKLSREEISKIRKKEAASSAALLNAKYYCLEENDSKVCYEKGAIEKSLDLFRKVCPAIVFTHTEFDYMMDHVMVSQLARGASFVYNAPNVSKTKSKEPGAPPYLYYCDSIGGTDIYGRPLPYSTYVDITDEMKLKVKMLRCHQSQDEWLSEYHGVDEYVASMQRQCRDRGHEIKTSFAEAFIQHRGHAYPQGDILTQLFSDDKELSNAV
jgi:LmbE family N-acetylglucosaminyl deacetylase